MLQKIKNRYLEMSRLMNIFFIWTTMGLLLADIILVVALVRVTGQNTITLLPPFPATPITVSATYVNAGYLQQMAEYFLLLRLNITPESVEHNYRQLLGYVASDVYATWLNELRRETDEIKKNNVSSLVTITDVQVTTDKFAVKLNGQLHQWVGLRRITDESSRCSWLVVLRYNHGHLFLQSIRRQELSA